MKGEFMATMTQQLLTAEEFMNLPDPPDGSQQELIRGVIVTMPPPKGRHGVCCAALVRVVGNHVHDNRLGTLTANDTGVILEHSPDTVRGPDIAFWSAERVKEIPDGYFEIPPDLAIEVVSPSDTHTKLQEKVRLYIKNGVRMVWLVDPELRIVTIYRTTGEARTLEENDTLSGDEVLPGFSCQVSAFFS
jgi:Uma2 family endonuclease